MSDQNCDIIKKLIFQKREQGISPTAAENDAVIEHIKECRDCFYDYELENSVRQAVKSLRYPKPDTKIARNIESIIANSCKFEQNKFIDVFYNIARRKFIAAEIIAALGLFILFTSLLNSDLNSASEKLVVDNDYYESFSYSQRQILTSEITDNLILNVALTKSE